MSLLERVYSFHQDILRGAYPNTTTLVEQFEISRATAKRDINYLRDRLLAPLAFDQARNGFYYTEEGFALPFGQSPKITLMLGILNKFAEEAGLSELDEVQQLQSKLSSMLSTDHSTLLQSLYCEWIEVESIDTKVFSAIIEAVVNRKAIHVSYAGAGASGAVSKRCVEPQRLCNYQGRWYLLAFCRMRQELRMFHVARITTATLTNEAISVIEDLDKNYLLPSFGIFKGEATENAVIHFTGTAADLIRHQHWHDSQQIENIEGGISLQLPISDYREITMKILQYGPMAKVISPTMLKEKVAGEIAAMSKLYLDPDTQSLPI